MKVIIKTFKYFKYLIQYENTSFNIFSYSEMIPRKSGIGGVSEKNFKPKFRKQPSDRDATEGTMTRFDCIVSGRPIPELIWFRDNQRVCNLEVK